MPECECGAFVTSEWARVMGDNNGKVHACIQCSKNTVGAEAGGIEGDDDGI